MRIRYKISLWIAFITLSVATMAGFFVYYEMREESYDIIDGELLGLSERLLSLLRSEPAGLQNADETVDWYYVRVSSRRGENLYQSRLAKLVTITSQPGRSHFTVTLEISHEHLWINPENVDDIEDLDDNNVLFRVFVKEVTVEGRRLVVTVAKPLPFITEDFKEVREQIIYWSLLTALLVICLSYLLAGRILAPLKTINAQLREINQTSLGRRIPLGKSKDELHELAVSLNSLFDRLEYSFEKQREFIGNAAHEIKTPITTLLLGHENLLNNRLPGNISEDIESQLNVLRRVSLLVKNLLDISRLEQQDTLNYETFELSELIEDILHEFEGLISSMNINVITNLDKVLFSGDRLKIQRMLINIVDNALKYNKTYGTITVSLSQVKKSAELRLSNTGSAIPHADLANIFDQFYRVDKSHSSRVDGFGLGLTIVKKIVELHDGTISASSTDVETSIRISMPIRHVKTE